MLTSRIENVLATDRATTAAGVQVVSETVDELVLSLPLTPEHTNGVGVCHGGIIFLLADAASGMWANTAVDGSSWVTTDSQIRFVAPARPGDVLEARCRRRPSAATSTAQYETHVSVGQRLVAVVDATMVRRRRSEA